MVITRITPTDENGKRQIFIDDEPFAELGADIVMQLDLHSGQELDESALDELIARAESLRAIQKAYTYLSYQALSRKKLAEKLKNAGFGETAVELALIRLEELGLVDDAALRTRLEDVMRHNKHWGPRRRETELYKRGIIPQEASAEEDDREHIRFHLEHKYRKKNLADPDERRRVTAGLVRLGFSFEDIRAVLREYITDTEDFE